MKYNVGDYVRTKFGAGEIRKIWALNDNITVFEVYLFAELVVPSYQPLKICPFKVGFNN